LTTWELRRALAQMEAERAAASPAPEATATDAEPGGTAAPAKRGAELYAVHCAMCHGADAMGGLGPRLRNASRKDPRSVERIIVKPTGAMPPLFPSSLNQEQVKDLAAFVATLDNKPH